VNHELPRTLKIATIWLLLGVLVFLGVQAWLAQRERMQFAAAEGTIEIRRGADGHYHWPGSVNGIAVDFLVDTGATSTALPQALAERARLKLEGRISSSTAGGRVQGGLAQADVFLEGGVQAQRLRVSVLPALDAPLLGMDVLSRLHWSQQGSVLRIEAAR
jgi:aspartyl protease family protein